MKSLPCTTFDHVLWLIEEADGTWRRGAIQLGECLFLFTSLDTLHAFIDGCDDCDTAGLRPAIFSRNRKEFGVRAREAAKAGLIGGLIDPPPGTGEAPFLRFSKAAPTQ